MAKDTLIRKIITLMGPAGNDLHDGLKALSDDDKRRIASVLFRPDLNVRYKPASKTVMVVTSYGSLLLDSENLTRVKSVYVNGQEYSILPGLEGVDALEHLTGSFAEVMLAVDEPIGRQRVGRRSRRSRASMPSDVSFEDVQKAAFEDLSGAGLTYQNFFRELGDTLSGFSDGLDASDLMSEICANDVDEKDIPHFLIYNSAYKGDIIARMYNYHGEPVTPVRNYETVHADDTTFIGRLIGALDYTEAEYDREHGVLTFDDDGTKRSITNLPFVDEKGIFHNGPVAYLPYYLGYFAEAEGDESRVDRLRVIDPVEQAITGVRLQYKLTRHGDIKFKTILDVTRNLPDFENHPYGQEILDTLKKKVVLNSRYAESNSLLVEVNNEKSGEKDDMDGLGVVALTMLDNDARGVIDPYGTSNGSNMGMIFYLTTDAAIEADGRIMPGTSEFSPVGEVLNGFHPDRDNFNRNQMSFNAFLTSLDVKKQNVFIGEFAFWNMEDSVVLTNDLGGTVKVGDKLEDFHGNKSTVSVILSDLTEEEIKERHLEHAVQFAKDNPHVDLITSPSSLASRLNMGIVYEGLDGERHDVTLPDGSVVPAGQTELMYMRLPQTAEHKSKDYAVEGNGRRYSTLFRYALTAKVGDLYTTGLISEEVRGQHIDEVASTFERLGVSFKDDSKLIRPGNINLFVDAPVTVSIDDFQHVSPAAIRLSLMRQMGDDNKININLGDITLKSRLYDGDVVDSNGHNVLPIRIPEGGTIPYRYTDLFTQISRGNATGIQTAYERFSDTDYGALTNKENLLKNIDTMTFSDDARTTVIVPDPSIGLGEVRSNVDDDRVIGHRDPAIQCGNPLSFRNVGGARPNVMHLNPLMINMQDGDFDGDTEGENAYKNLTLTEEEKDEFFARSSVIDRVNFYGEVNLGTNSSYFKALSKVNGIPTDDITFADGKTSEEIVTLVEEKTRQILDSPKSYGAYAISFADEQAAKNSLCKLADDGIKGNREDMERYLEQGYTDEENRAVAKALIAKSEWTGLAGATTNKLIANLDPSNHEVLRSAMDVTWSMTQSTLQMKKNADKLLVINDSIQKMKAVMDGIKSTEESRSILKAVTKGLLPEAAVDEFVDKVSELQTENKDVFFGYGVINHQDPTTTKLAYASAKTFERAISDLGEEGRLAKTQAANGEVVTP